ncbi:MAG: TRAP transporter large permease [Desulfobacterales bacterium]|nr:TRAP transporter large permease [Desulfobacterales bacterium]
MTPVEIGFAGIFLMLALMLLGVHIGLALMISGFLGFAMIGGWQAALSNMALISFDKTNNFHFAVVPFYMLMSSFVAASGMGREIYDFGRSIVGQYKGGLAVATTAGVAVFSAVSGSSLACCVTFSKIAYPEMKKSGYDEKLALGSICAGASMDVMIPPSNAFVIIGILAELSIGKLFIAGIVPGIVQALGYIILILIWCTLYPQDAPRGPKSTPREKLIDTFKTWPVLVLFLIVMGGIYGGFFTAIEAGAVGAFFTFIVPLIRGQWTRKRIFDALFDAGKITAMIILILIGAFVFNAFLAVTRISFLATDWIIHLPLHPMVILSILMVIYVLLGCIFDIYAILILTIPIVYPAVEAMGYDLFWWSIVMTFICEIGFITPPFGLNLFGMASALPEVRLGTIYQSVVPFLVADAFILAILVAFPWLSLWLIRMM